MEKVAEGRILDMHRGRIYFFSCTMVKAALSRKGLVLWFGLQHSMHNGGAQRQGAVVFWNRIVYARAA